MISPTTHAGSSVARSRDRSHCGNALTTEGGARADPEQRAARDRVIVSTSSLLGIAHQRLVGALTHAAQHNTVRTVRGARPAVRRGFEPRRSMVRLLSRLLAYAGQGRFVTMRLDPDVMLGDLREQLAKIVQRPVTLHVVPGAGAVVIEAEPSLLRDVVIQLVTQASDAASHRVQVASRLEPGDSAPWWLLEVSDDGAGIDPAVLARIFDPSAIRGAGLAAARATVQRFGGDLEVDSKPGKGARFRIRLPIVLGAAPAARSSPEIALPTRRLAGLSLLVADDEPSVRTTVRRLLERRGATVVVAADGLEAEARLREARFDLVVLDVTMPGRNGYEVLAFARVTHAKMPVILMSGYIARSRGEAGEDEPDAFIEKPFTAKVLDAAIDAVLGIRGEPSPAP